MSYQDKHTEKDQNWCKFNKVKAKAKAQIPLGSRLDTKRLDTFDMLAVSSLLTRLGHQAT